jgi:hypothetical protein
MAMLLLVGVLLLVLLLVLVPVGTVSSLGVTTARGLQGCLQSSVWHTHTLTSHA